MLNALGVPIPSGGILVHAVIGAFEETPWIGYVFGTIVGLALLAALVMSIAFAPVDLHRRDDIGPGRKLLWLAAFVLSAGIVLVIYGAVRYSRTEGTPGA